MSDSMKGNLPPHRSCNEWADLLAFTPEEQLSPDERAAFTEHMLSCATCAAMHDDYRLLTTYMRRALSVTPLPHLPDSVLAKMQGASSRSHPFSHLLASLKKKRAGAYRLLSIPRGYTIAGMIGIIIIILLARLVWPLNLFQTFTNNVHAASLSWHQSLTLPRLGATSVHTISWSPDGKYLAVLWDDSTMQVLDAHTYHEIFHQTVEWGHGLAWSPDSQYLASIGREDNTIQIWNVSTQQCAVNTLHHCLIYTGHTAQIEAIAWSPNGNSIASASDDQTVQVWDARSMKQLYTYRDPGSVVTTIAWSPDGERLVSGDNNDQIQAWDALTGAHPVSYRGHTGPITFVSWSPDGNSILSSSYDGTVRIWNTSKEGSDLPPLPIHVPIFAAATWWETENQGYLALSVGSSVQLWQLVDQQGKILRPYELGTFSPPDQEQHDNIVSLSWSPRGGHMITGESGVILDFQPGA